MKKTATKFLILLFCGLLCLTVSPSYAADETTQGGVARQSAIEFLKKNIAGSDLSEAEDIIGDGTGNIVSCGRTLCNLKFSTCLRRENVKVSRKGTKEKITYEYLCVPQDEAGNYSDWEVAPEDQTNIRKKVTVTQDGKEIKNKEKEFKNSDKRCFTAQTTADQGAQQYCLKLTGGEVRVYSANKKGRRKCEVIPVNWHNNKKCRFCSLIGTIYKVADDITVVSAQKLAQAFAIIIALGLALWVAIKTLIFVSSMTKQDAAKYITEMVKQSYKFMIAFFLLLYYQNVFTYIINPLLQAGLNFGNRFVTVESWDDRFDGRLGSASEIACIDDGLKQELPPDYRRNCDNQYYRVDIYQQMEHFAYNVNQRYSLLQTIGSTLLCLGGKYIAFRINNAKDQLGLGISCVAYGIFFWGFGFLLCLAFVFYLLDAVVQLGVVGALLPFLIASWPFKITEKYTSTGFKMLLNSIFTFMMMGIIVDISMKLISSSLAINVNATDGSSGLLALVEALDKIDTERLKEMVNVFSAGFLLFLFANMFGFLLLGRVTDAVDKFASGGMKASSPGIATMGASAVKGAAMKAAQPTMEAAGDWVKEKTKQATRWGVDKAVGLATLRPVRRWANKKIEARGNKAADGARGTTQQSKGGAQAPQGSTKPPVIGGGARGTAQQSKGGTQAPQNNQKPPVIGGGAGGTMRQTGGGNPAPQGSAKPANAGGHESPERAEQTGGGNPALQGNTRPANAGGHESPERAEQTGGGNPAPQGNTRPANDEKFIRKKPTTKSNGRRPTKRTLKDMD